MSVLSIPTTNSTKGTPPLKHMLGQFPCPFCTSSNAFTVWEQEDKKKDGYCFSCGRSSKDPDRDLLRSHSIASDASFNGSKLSSTANQSRVSSPDGSARIIQIEDGLSHPTRALQHRHLSYATCEHFGVKVGVSSKDGETPIYTLFPRYRDGELIGWKQKTLNKEYTCSGGSSVDLFNSHNIPPTGKKLWITEGEEDAMSIFQALRENSSFSDWTPACISLASGSTSAAKSIASQLELIDGYEEVILVFDTDVSGKKARDEVCKILAGKVSYVTLPLKDANEMVQRSRSVELKWAVLSPKKFQPDGIVNVKDLWESYNEKKHIRSFSYPAHMVGLNDKTYGVRDGSLVTIAAGTGSGKTQLLRELMYHFWGTTDEKIAGMFLEEDRNDTISGLIALDVNKRIQLPDVKLSDQARKESFDKLFSSGRFNLYEFFGGMDDGSLLAKLRWFAVTGHKFIFLDHLSIVVSEYAAEGGERERLDTLMTKLAKLAKEFGIILFLVVHLRKADSSGKSFELGTQPSLDDLRGSSSIKQLSFDVLLLGRNQQHSDPYCANTTEIVVGKCRFTGRTGVAGYLHFDDNTGRLYTCERPLNYRPKRGSNNDSNEF